MNVFLEVQADADLRELTARYQSIRPELAENFVNAVYKRFDEIVAFPAPQSGHFWRIAKMQSQAISLLFYLSNR